MRRGLFMLSSLLFLLCSCEKEESERYPSVITDYACMLTDASGQPGHLRLDNGREYPIALTDTYREAHPQLPSYRADTLYRIVGIYELGNDDVANIYSIARTVSGIPTPLHSGETMRNDPVYLQSSWLSGGYLNMVLELKALDGQHSIGFVDTTPKGMQGKEFTLYHDSHNDVESYRQKLYASIPLAPFKRDLQQGNILRIVINLYDKGVSQWEFVME